MVGPTLEQTGSSVAWRQLMRPVVVLPIVATLILSAGVTSVAIYNLKATQNELKEIKHHNKVTCHFLRGDLKEYKSSLLQTKELPETVDELFMHRALAHCLPTSAEQDKANDYMFEIQKGLWAGNRRKAAKPVDKLIEMVSKHYEE